MFKKSVKIGGALYDRLKSAAESVGAASVDEFVQQILQRECDVILNANKNKELSSAEVDNITQSLKGLGYLE